MGNRLSRIVTRTGDDGRTGLADGSRVDKDAPRLEAIGTIDELSSVIGFAASLVPQADDTARLRDTLALVQHDLFDLGGALSRPGAELLSEAHVRRLEAAVGEMNATLPPLKEFTLPGGSPAVGAFHMARTVARRAERRLVSALDLDPQPAACGLAYLNRLSDLLFVAARTVARSEDGAEVLWEPGKSLA